jgi:hypothetical protein
MPVARIFSNATTSGILSLMTGLKILDSQSGYRAYNTNFLKDLTIVHNHFEMESEVILRAWHSRQDVRFIPVQALYCKAHSHISHVLDTLRWISAVTKLWFNLIMQKRPVHPV